MKAALALAFLSLACERPPSNPPGDPLGQGTLAAFRTSELVAGAEDSAPPPSNPFDGDSQALRDGEQLYNYMNCTGCHGALGGGGIGPPLRDRDWIYGGEPGQIYASVAQGRPNGMPSFGRHLPPESIWRIVAYVETLKPEASRRGGRAGSVAEGRSQDNIAGGTGSMQ
ncbi:MAG TPA: c-type cytochrome [Gemmatimonadales bacterium]|nr:c-type cytochrome [Gemmatimonadales bacterium]